VHDGASKNTKMGGKSTIKDAIVPFQAMQNNTRRQKTQKLGF